MKKVLRFVLAFIAAWPLLVPAQTTTYSQQVGADTFVSSGAPDANFGLQGAMEIAAPTAAQPRTQIALLRFDTAAVHASFDADLGAGNWVVTSVTLTLFSSVATAGQQPNNSRFNQIAPGGFEFDLLGNNSWSESAITWNTLPNILPGNGNANTLTPLGTFTWDATGAASTIWALTRDQLLLDAINNGNAVSLLGQPTPNSTVGYLVNSLSTAPACLNVTAATVPEPSTVTLLASILCVAGCSRLYRREN